MNTSLKEITKYHLDSIKQTIVPDLTEREDLHFTANVNEWLEIIKQTDILSKNTEKSGPFNPDRVSDLFGQHAYHLNFDHEIIKNASGYITAPVFKYNSKVDCPSTKICNSLQELKDFLSNKKYFLYLIIVSIKSERIKTVEADLFTIIPKRPMFGAPEIKYTFRGYIL